ncbi:universal stress protein [Pendulispora brunnea]|uniref:Universal stress protein n=1 Tax=Pendulispora brunnea TaxID=2905690 RepID=A0ABZ2JYX1_9BACT
MATIRHILLATDFGPASQRALVTAAEIAEAMHAKVTVIHVIDPPESHVSIEGLCDAARRPLDAVVDTLHARHVECSSILRRGRPWQEIVRATNEAHANLVLVGSHGRRGIVHTLIGSVAEKVTRHSSVPVLTVHGFWFEDRRQAGHELGERLTALGLPKPAVIAISRGGIVVAAEVSRALGTSLDILLTRPLRQHGMVFGALCENGTRRIDPEITGLAKLSKDRETIVLRERAALDEEVHELQTVPYRGELTRRTVVLVTDALMDTWSAKAADAAVRSLGAHRIIFATPLASAPVKAALTNEPTEVVAIHSIPAGFDPAAAYRYFREPSTRNLVDALRSVTIPDE